MTEVKLPSGAVLKMGQTPFEESLSLWEAVVEELKVVTFTSETEMSLLYKDLFCLAFSSKRIKAALWKCFDRCTYNPGQGEFRITKDTFEPVEARQDYATICAEVGKFNILPFVKPHLPLFDLIKESLRSSQKSQSQTTPS